MALIGIDVSGEKEIQKQIDALPDAVKDAVTKDVLNLLLNVERKYPPFVHVTRAEAYPNAPAGPGWFSKKQRGFVMAAIREGTIKPGVKKRNQKLSKGWQIIGEGQTALLVNEVEYAPYLKDDVLQAGLPALAGWKKLSTDLKDHAERISKTIQASAKKALKKVGAK